MQNLFEAAAAPRAEVMRLFAVGSSATAHETAARLRAIAANIHRAYIMVHAPVRAEPDSAILTLAF